MGSAPRITGVYTAIVTPFTKDGQIDWGAFDKLLQRQALAEVDGVVITGTTGESPTLSVDEKVSLYRRARAFLPTNIKVMAGTGGNDTRQSVELSKLAQDAGVDSLLIVTPPYNKPTREGLYAHYDAIGKAVRIPLCLYHVPSRTGQRLSPEDLAYICSLPQVTAVKEASADLSLFSKAVNLTQGQADYLSGDDFTFLPTLAAGGQGVISVVTNIFPRAFVQLTRRFRRGDTDGALAIHQAIFTSMECLFLESNPGPAKYVLASQGLIQDSLRLPLVSVQQATAQRLNECFEQTKRKLEELGALS
jgi:4-hydroxy-tetrahydrodipicolinate synthase